MFNYYQHQFNFIKSNIQQFPAVISGRFHFISPTDETQDYIGKRSDLPYAVQDSIQIAETTYNLGTMTISLLLVECGILLEYQPAHAPDNWYVWIDTISIDCSPKFDNN